MIPGLSDAIGGSLERRYASDEARWSNPIELATDAAFGVVGGKVTKALASPVTSRLSKSFLNEVFPEGAGVGRPAEKLWSQIAGARSIKLQWAKLIEGVTEGTANVPLDALLDHFFRVTGWKPTCGVGYAPSDPQCNSMYASCPAPTCNPQYSSCMSAINYLNYWKYHFGSHPHYAGPNVYKFGY